MSYQAVFHVDLDENKRLDLALANVANLLKAIPGQSYDLVILFNGPAVTLLKKEQSAAQEEAIVNLQKEKVVLKACNNALTKFQVAPEDLVAGVEIVPAGIVELIDLQKKGYAYIKP